MRAVGVLAVLLIAGSALVAQEQSSRAMEVWERVIGAKGGRTRLMQIENIQFTVRPEKKTLPLNVSLYVFPDKSWTYMDWSGTLLGKRLTVFDGAGVWELLDESGPQRRGIRENETFDLLEVQAWYLLETQWFRPRIFRIETKKIGRTEFDVVTAAYREWQLQYYVDKRSSMVRRVAAPNNSPEVRSLVTSLGGYVDFEEYSPVAGIMMPRRVTWPRDGVEIYDHQLNVKPHPELFTRKPALADGPNGWKANP